MLGKITNYKLNIKDINNYVRNLDFYTFAKWVGLIRPAPAELPQVRKEARVGS